MRIVIVDGYNVIRADPRLHALESVSLEHARMVLARTLASSPRLARDRVIVVFDGRNGTRRHVHQQRVGRVDVLYSGQGQTADEVIVQQSEVLARQGPVVVVSNDVAVREACRMTGAEVSGSENLLAQVPGRQPSRPRLDVDDDAPRSLSTEKRGNPRRRARNSRHRDYRF